MGEARCNECGFAVPWPYDFISAYLMRTHRCGGRSSGRGSTPMAEPVDLDAVRTAAEAGAVRGIGKLAEYAAQLEHELAALRQQVAAERRGDKVVARYVASLEAQVAALRAALEHVEVVAGNVGRSPSSAFAQIIGICRAALAGEPEKENTDG